MEVFAKSIQHLVEINLLSLNMWKKMGNLEEWNTGVMLTVVHGGMSLDAP
jgi:hypothetical protein